MSEQFYDDEIAPVLAELAEKCRDNGLSLVAVCEYAEDQIGRTSIMQQSTSAAMRLAMYGALARGNVDDLVGMLIKDGKENGHGSIYLTMLDQWQRRGGDHAWPYVLRSAVMEVLNKVAAGDVSQEVIDQCRDQGVDPLDAIQMGWSAAVMMLQNEIERLGDETS